MNIFGMRFTLPVQGILFMVASGLLGAPVQAAEALSTEQQIQAALLIKLPNLQVDSVQASAWPGLYEVVFGTNIVYVDKSARYILNGDLFDLEAQQSVTATRSCLLYTSPSPRDGLLSRMPSSA